MREIKFRAWDNEKSIMFPNAHAAYDWLNHPTISGEFLECQNFSDVISDERFDLMQYTGLKDRNSVDIYESDILSYDYYEPKDGEPNLGTVVFRGKGWSCDNIGQFDFMTYWQHPAFEWLKIVGNIHENPDLMEQP